MAQLKTLQANGDWENLWEKWPLEKTPKKITPLRLRAKNPAGAKENVDEQLRFRAKNPAGAIANVDEQLCFRAKNPAEAIARVDEQLRFRAKNPARAIASCGGLRLRRSVSGTPGYIPVGGIADYKITPEISQSW